MKEEAQNIRTTPERILKMLREEHIEINEAEAIKILAFLKKIARMTVAKYLEENEC